MGLSDYLNWDFLRFVSHDYHKHNDRRIYFDYRHFCQVIVDVELLMYLYLTTILFDQSIQDDRTDHFPSHEDDN